MYPGAIGANHKSRIFVRYLIIGQRQFFDFPVRHYGFCPKIWCRGGDTSQPLTIDAGSRQRYCDEPDNTTVHAKQASNYEACSFRVEFIINNKLVHWHTILTMIIFLGATDLSVARYRIRRCYFLTQHMAEYKKRCNGNRKSKHGAPNLVFRMEVLNKCVSWVLATLRTRAT